MNYTASDNRARNIPPKLKKSSPTRHTLRLNQRTRRCTILASLPSIQSSLYHQKLTIFGGRSKPLPYHLLTKQSMLATITVPSKAYTSLLKGDSKAKGMLRELPSVCVGFGDVAIPSSYPRIPKVAKGKVSKLRDGKSKTKCRLSLLTNTFVLARKKSACLPFSFSTISAYPSIPKVTSFSTSQAEVVTASEANNDNTVNLWDQKRPTYPFTAIVGQEEMKLALLLNVIDPKIGGVMIMGDRGTGKSTTVRALVDLLPTIKVVDNDPFNSHPSDAELMSQNVREQVLQGTPLKIVSKKTTMIDLPLGATEDRVCGTIDIERALSEGVKAFEPGLLAKANRGILYVDEVNLLDDHLVDILLDSAASGWNTVEREGISISHPARFILVGSGNPEEGELRPQLLDRFGMHAQIGTVREAELRVKIVEERANFDKSPVNFLHLHQEKQKELADKIVAARHLLGAVKIDYDLRVKISQVCGQLNVDGLRGDIVTNRASQALAAFEARTNVTPQDIFRVIPLCLRHRLRKDPLEPIDSGNRVQEVFKQVFGFVSDKVSE